jgi:hypothetical protein
MFKWIQACAPFLDGHLLKLKTLCNNFGKSTIISGKLVEWWCWMENASTHSKTMQCEAIVPDWKDSKQMSDSFASSWYFLILVRQASYCNFRHFEITQKNPQVFSPVLLAQKTPGKNHEILIVWLDLHAISHFMIIFRTSTSWFRNITHQYRMAPPVVSWFINRCNHQ